MPKENFVPAYRKTYEKGLFPDIVQKANDMLESCTVCPRDFLSVRPTSSLKSSKLFPKL